LWWAGAPTRVLLIAAIRVYRATLSGMLGGQCRFHPSCSEYAEQAIRSVGALRGSVLGAWRILRCSPLSAGGVDRAPRSFRAYDSDIHTRRGVQR
jgi:putative membrane protein insertion efficiency factor